MTGGETVSARASWADAIRPYLRPAPLAAFGLGISSGFPFAMIGATLTTRLAQDGISKSAVTAFALTFLAYNLKWAWAPVVDKFRIPLLGRIGQRRSWLLVASGLVFAAVTVLGSIDPTADLAAVAFAAICVGLAGATFDIVIDAYRIELLKPEELGIGSGMSQYGWRIGSAGAGALALVVAARFGWEFAYLVCAFFVLPALLVAVLMGEPVRKVAREWPEYMGRKAYALFAASAVPVSLAGQWIDNLLDVTILSRMVLVGYAFPMFDLTARRARDAGVSSHWTWVMLAPVIGILIGVLRGWDDPLAIVLLGVGTVAAIVFASLKPVLGEGEGAIEHGRKRAVLGPLAEFFRREGGWLILLFVLVHKLGDTLANLTLRLLFEDLGYTNDEIAFYDVGIGWVALIVGIFVGGILYARIGMKRSVLISLILMGISNLSFAALAAAGKSNLGMALAMGFENFASGIGGVCVVAYLSALCNLSFTATQFAMLSAAASVLGRFLSGTTAGSLIEAIGYVEYYLLTTLLAVPGMLLFWLMMRSGLVDASVGSAAQAGAPREAQAEP